MAWEDDETMPRPPGVALVYIPEGPSAPTVILDRADLAIMPARDRALCRGLIAHVVAQLDKADAAGN